MPTLADLFRAQYRGTAVDFAAIRVHAGGAADLACQALGARAFTAGTDVYLTGQAFRPDTREGLWLLAHEVAHVVQQQAAGVPRAGIRPAGLSDAVVLPPGTAAERAADAAADALVAGRAHVFDGAGDGTLGRARAGGQPVVQRYMAWEHSMLGDVDPELVEAAAGGDAGPVCSYRDLLFKLGQDPREVDAAALRAAHPGLDAVRLPGSGLVLTLGELNVLPDYLGRPEEIETAPGGFIGPLIQSVRSWSAAELDRSAARLPGGRGPLSAALPGLPPFPPLPALPRLLPGSLRYPMLGPLAETVEISSISSLGRRHGFTPAHLYSAVLARNSGHFAPFSWYRWHEFHLLARDLIAQSAAADGPERESLRARARIFAGYADHFLQDSFAAGHLINKTLVIQWYIEWLAEQGVVYPGRGTLDTLTAGRQPLLHGPGHYDRAAARMAATARGLNGGAPGLDDGAAGKRPGGVPGPPWDAQDVADAATLQERITASGVTGDSDEQRRAAYQAYLTMLGSGTVQLAVKVAHEYLNKHSLVVSAGPLGPRFRLNGDHSLLAGQDGARQAAQAAADSRRAIAELLRDGETTVDSWDIFARFPDHVEQGGRMISLPEWHRTGLRELCTELFAQPATRAVRGVMSAAFRRLASPVDD